MCLICDLEVQIEYAQNCVYRVLIIYFECQFVCLFKLVSERGKDREITRTNKSRFDLQVLAMNFIDFEKMEDNSSSPSTSTYQKPQNLKIHSKKVCMRTRKYYYECVHMRVCVSVCLLAYD